MRIRQLSIFIENKPGHLRAACRLLANSDIDVESMALADTEQFGILRFIIKDWSKAKQVLENEGLIVRESDLLAVSVADRPGGLADVLEVLDQTKINIEYMYGYASLIQGKAILFFRFNDSDIDEVVELLQKNNILLIPNSELFRS
jgi:ACT domain-containing protein